MPNGPNLVVLGHALWSRRYAADPAIVGRSILINGRPYEVVGVMPPDFVLPTDFQNPEPTQLWLPLQLDPASTDHGSHGLYAAARLKPGVTVSQAADELHGIAQAMTSEGLYPQQMQFDTVVLSLTDEVVGTVRRAIWLLFGAVGIPAADRLRQRGEPAARPRRGAPARDRGALRARRQRPARRAAAAHRKPGALGPRRRARPRARVRRRALPRVVEPREHPARVAASRSTPTVLVFTAIVALLTSIIFSLAPALRALRVDLTDSLKDGSQSSSSGGARQRFRNGLVIVEMALAVVLLVGAGLMLRSLWSLQRIDLGFNPADVLTMRLSLPQASYRTPGAGRRLLRAPARARSRHSRACARPAPSARCRSRRRSATSVCGSKATCRRRAPARRGTGRSRPTATSRRIGRARRARTHHRAVRHDRRHARRAHQRGDGAPLLGGPGSDRRALQDRRQRANGPGSPSSASSPTSGTTASPTSSRRSSTSRTRSGTGRSATRFAP